VIGKKETTLTETDEHIYMFNKQANKHKIAQKSRTDGTELHSSCV